MSIAEITKYSNGVPIDTSLFYYRNGNLKKRVLWNKTDSTGSATKYDINGNLKCFGDVIFDSVIKPIGRWVFPIQKNTDSIVYYKILNHTVNVNEIYFIKNSDTLLNKSMFFTSRIKDTLFQNEESRVEFYLNAPRYSGSKTEFIMYDTIKNLGFKNLDLSQNNRDTIKCLSMDNIYHPEFPDDFPQDRKIDFKIIFQGEGKRKIEGLLTEYVYLLDSTKVERRQFFEKDVIVITR